MRIDKRGLVLWGLYVGFATYAIYTYRHDGMFNLDGPLAGLKIAVWIALVGFFAYSIYCTARENFFRSLREIAKLHWGRQIGTDLYLGLFVAMIIIYLNEGAVAVLIWFLPTLVFANLSILLYVALNFDTIVQKFAGL